jgi:cell division ATPase FtsA
MSIFLSICGEQMLALVEDTIRRHFHFETIKFSSFAMASFTVIRDMYADQENFLLLDIGGEVTDIFLAKKNVLRESVSYPLGINFLTRGVASKLGCTLEEAGSLISLFKDGHAEKSVAQKLELIMAELKKEWLKNFQESLANLSKDISVPSTIFVIVDKNMVEFFSEIIKSEQFSQYTLTESKFEVTFLGLQALHGAAQFEENVIRDPFLVVDSVYINRFLTKI